LFVFEEGPNVTLIRWFLNQILGRWGIVLIFFLPVLSYFLFSLGRIVKEIRACRKWAGSNLGAEESQVVQELEAFLQDDERWRVQGIAVPMADYSDRIDSLIEGLADRLHNGVNLFLVAGLAGTFFGMAEFARQTSALQQATDSRVILAALRDALGHSFPIGFLGLTLTVFLHPVASHYEGKLREAAAHAVKSSLHRRTDALERKDSGGLLDVIRRLPQELASAIASTHKDLIDQLQPLLQLPEAIQKSNEQSLGPIRELFAESRKEWKETVAKLDRQSGRIADSIARLENPIQRLTARIDDIGALIASTQQIVERVLSDAQKISETTEGLRSKVDETAKGLHTAAEEFHGLPTLVKADLSNLHEILRERIGSYYELLGREYVSSIRELAASSAGDIARAAREAGDKVNAAAHALRGAAEVITPELKSAITSGADYLRRYLEEFDVAFRQSFPKAVADLQTSLADTSGRIEVARGILEGMVTASERAGEHAEQWKRVEGRLVEVSTALRQDTLLLDRSATTIKSADEALARAAVSLERKLAALESTLKNSPKPPTRPSGDGYRPSIWKRIFGKAASHGA